MELHGGRRQCVWGRDLRAAGLGDRCVRRERDSPLRGDKFAPAGGRNPRKEIDVGAARMMSGWAMRGTDAFRIWPNSRAGLLPPLPIPLPPSNLLSLSLSLFSLLVDGANNSD